MKKIILLALVLTNFTATTQESVLLRYNYNIGDNYLITAETVVSGEEESGDKGYFNLKLVINSSVISADDKAIMLESKLESIFLLSTEGEEKVEIDWNKTMNKELTKTEQTLLDGLNYKATTYNTIDHYGNLLERTESNLQNSMLGFEGIIFPYEEVSVGSSWTNETDKQGTKGLIKYTVSKISEGAVLLNVSGTGAAEGVSLDVNGKVTVDISSGAEVASTTKITMSVQGIETSWFISGTMTKM